MPRDTFAAHFGGQERGQDGQDEHRDRPRAHGRGRGDRHGRRAKVKGHVLRVRGDDTANQIALRLRFGDATTLEVDFGNDGTAEFSFDRSKFDQIVVDARGGDDSVRIDQMNGVFTDTEETTLGGGDGGDTLLGGDGVEAFQGGDGTTSSTASGETTARRWARATTPSMGPGDGSDTIDGEAGTDTMLFNGANVAETIDMSANGSRLRFTRNVANIVMDTSGVEHVRFNARGGVDLILHTFATLTSAAPRSPPPVAVHMLHADATNRLDVSRWSGRRPESSRCR